MLLGDSFSLHGSAHVLLFPGIVSAVFNAPFDWCMNHPGFDDLDLFSHLIVILIVELLFFYC